MKKPYSTPELSRQAARHTPLSVAIIIQLAGERQKLREGLLDLLAYYDHRGQHGWTAADIHRLDEIRALVKR